MVDGLLTVARAENVVPVPVAVNVAEVAGERVVAWHPVADDRSIVLVASSARPVLAWIGEGHLEQILDNVIANALDALSPGHMVRLTTTATATGAPCPGSTGGRAPPRHPFPASNRTSKEVRGMWLKCGVHSGERAPSP